MERTRKMGGTKMHIGGSHYKSAVTKIVGALRLQGGSGEQWNYPDSKKTIYRGSEEWNGYLLREPKAPTFSYR
jgi:hypothetical protein